MKKKNKVRKITEEEYAQYLAEIESKGAKNSIEDWGRRVAVRKIRLRAFYFRGGRYAMSKKRQNYYTGDKIVVFLQKNTIFSFPRGDFFLETLDEGKYLCYNKHKFIPLFLYMV